MIHLSWATVGEHCPAEPKVLQTKRVVCIDEVNCQNSRRFVNQKFSSYLRFGMTGHVSVSLQKNIYNFIIDKKPGAGRKKADPAPVDEGPVAQPPKSLIPSVRPITQLPITPENGDSAIDSLNFSEFLTAQNVSKSSSDV